MNDVLRIPIGVHFTIKSLFLNSRKGLFLRNGRAPVIVCFQDNIEKKVISDFIYTLINYC
jgi:hypothetical protein